MRSGKINQAIFVRQKTASDMIWCLEFRRVLFRSSDITGREVRTIEGTKPAGLNRVRWNLQGNPASRGAPPAAAGQAAQPAAAAAALQPPATNPPATPPATGRQGAGREDRPVTTAATQGRGGQPAPAAGDPTP